MQIMKNKNCDFQQFNVAEMFLVGVFNIVSYIMWTLECFSRQDETTIESKTFERFFYLCDKNKINNKSRLKNTSRKRM